MIKQMTGVALSGWVLASGVWAVESAGSSNTMGSVMQAVTEIHRVLDEKGIVVNVETARVALVDALIKSVDPLARIATREEAARIEEETQGRLYGVGMTIKILNNFPKVVDINAGGPSEKSGIKPDEIIQKIGNVSTEGKTIEEVVGLLRGGKDEPVELTMRGPGKEAQPRQVKMVRGLIQMPVLAAAEQWPHQIGYIRVNGLYSGAGALVVERMKGSVDVKCYGIILDLRDANGTDLASIVDIAKLFDCPDATVLRVRDGAGKETAAYTVKDKQPLGMPVMVLVNRGTCGASEALAGVLQRCKGAMLIGASTCGDDRVREFIPLPDGRVLYVATRQVDLLGGMRYGNSGLKPDIGVLATASAVATNELDLLANEGRRDVFASLALSEEEKQDRELIKRIGGDVVLRRATDILLGLQALDIKPR